MAQLFPNHQLPTLSVEIATRRFSQVQSLEQAWTAAQQRFQNKTLKSLNKGKNRKTLEEILNQWQLIYDGDNNYRQQNPNEMKDVLDTILSGIELVGAFAAQTLSSVFAPAGMCFNAVEVLLQANKAIEKYYDTLKSLFEEVAAFLARFKVLKKIDDTTKLDSELIITTNHLLIAFIDICAETIPHIQGHKVRIAFEVGFLRKDPNVSKALENFRELSRRHDSMSNAVQLKTVLESKEVTNQILSVVQSVAATSHHQKTFQVNRERLEAILPAFFTTEERSNGITSQRVHIQTTLLPGTLEVLTTTPHYKQWSESPESGRKFLFLSGEKSTGKSSMLEAVLEKLTDDLNSNDLIGGDPSIYVASHTFEHDHARSSVSNNSSLETSVTFALKSLAYQVAEQSTKYSKYLNARLKERKHIKSIENVSKLWNELQLCNFGAPANSVMYLLLDGLHRLGKSSVKSLIKILGGDRRKGAGEGETGCEIPKMELKVRVLVACDAEAYSWVEHFPSINLGSINSTLIKAFTMRRMISGDVFQDDDSKTVGYRDQVLEQVPEKANGRFDIVRQKVELIREALDRDADTTALTTIMNDDENVTENEEGEQVLRELEANLSPQQAQQLNSILKWVACGIDSRAKYTISQIETFLLLEQGHQTLESLTKKIHGRFSKVLTEQDTLVYMNKDVYYALREREEKQSSDSDPGTSLISMDIRIERATEEVIRQYFWEINEQLTSGKFNFGSMSTNHQPVKIRLSKKDGQLSIVRAYLKLLNEEPQEETAEMIKIALYCLPRHLKKLGDLRESLSLPDRISVTQSLASFLSSSYNMEQHIHSILPSIRTAWFEDDLEYVKSMRDWIMDLEVMAHLQPNERRWIKQTMVSSTNDLGFLRQFAIGLCQVFSIKAYEVPKGAFLWMDMYLGIMSSSTTEFKRSEEDMNDDSDELNATELIKKSVNRVMNWAHEVAGVTRDGFHLLQAGNLCSFLGDAALSAQFYNLAAETGFDGWRLSLYRAISYRDMGENEMATSHMLHALKRENAQGNDPWDAVDNKIGFLSLMSFLLVEWYEEDERFQEAIVVLQELLKEVTRAVGRWYLLYLYCAAHRTSEAIAYLKDWSEHPDKYEGNGPAISWLQLANIENDNFGQEAMILMTRDDEYRFLLAKIVEESVLMAENTEEEDHHLNVILYLQGLILAGSNDTAHLTDAVECFQRSLNVQIPQRLQRTRDSESLFKSSCRLGLHAFNNAYNKLCKTSSISLEEKTNLADELEKTVSGTLAEMSKRMDLRFNYICKSPKTYASSFYALIGLNGRSRSIIKPDVAAAVEILSDNDPDNDEQGVSMLIGALHCAGDYVGALTAFSLMDRRSIPADTDDIASAPQSGDAYAGGFMGHMEYSRRCDGCAKSLPTAIDGTIRCKFCPDTDFCRKCYEELIRGDRPGLLCKQNHDFVHYYHTKYSEEERAPGQIKIDWELEMNPDLTFTRKGGRIVSTDEWLAKIREEWDIPIVESNARAQK